jgi:hypothetical protein
MDLGDGNIHSQHQSHNCHHNYLAEVETAAAEDVVAGDTDLVGPSGEAMAVASAGSSRHRQWSVPWDRGLKIFLLFYILFLI